MEILKSEVYRLPAMGNGYLGRLLTVDLAAANVQSESMPENPLHDFIGRGKTTSDSRSRQRPEGRNGDSG